MKRLFPTALLLASLAGGFAMQSDAAPVRRVTVAGLSTYQRELLTRSMDLSAQTFDVKAHLIVRPVASHSNARGGYMVRESSWYALGLLLRDGPGDRAEAAAILHTVLANQYRTPGVKWYGTFKRSPEEATPGTGDANFTSYDPNWRTFVGTAFQMILQEFPERISAELQRELQESIRIAITGEMQDGRLKESYSNIALMYGALWEWSAEREHDAAWAKGAAAWNAEVFRIFREHNTFDEYNAPTYYGVDLYGLGLWVRYGSPATQQMGRAMQAALWRGIADYYNPLLRNLCGPYDRSYGMDMERYVSVTGVWLRSVLPATVAPLPETPTLKTDHMADLWFAPMISILGTDIPADAMVKFRSFAGPHFLTRQIDAQRTATSSVGQNLLYGAEFTGRTKDTGHATQFHPVTAQWRTPAGSIGWIRLTQSPNVDAVADARGVTIQTHGDVDFLLYAEGMDSTAIGAKVWVLPGLRVTVASDGVFSAKAQTTPSGEPGVAVHFGGVSRIRLDFTQSR